jgi:hypothetical protein
MRLLVDLMFSLPYMYSHWSEVTTDKPLMLWDSCTMTGTVDGKVYAIANQDRFSNYRARFTSSSLANPVRYYHTRGDNDQTLTVVFHGNDGSARYNSLHVDVVAK